MYKFHFFLEESLSFKIVLGYCIYLNDHMTLFWYCDFSKINAMRKKLTNGLMR